MQRDQLLNARLLLLKQKWTLKSRRLRPGQKQKLMLKKLRSEAESETTKLRNDTLAEIARLRGEAEAELKQMKNETQNFVDKMRSAAEVEVAK